MPVVHADSSDCAVFGGGGVSGGGVSGGGVSGGGVSGGAVTESCLHIAGGAYL